jgi:hypothetical protein
MLSDCLDGGSEALVICKFQHGICAIINSKDGRYSITRLCSRLSLLIAVVVTAGD